MKNEAQELLMEWAGITKEFYRVTDLEEDTFDNAISLMERAGQLEDTLYIEHNVPVAFIRGADGIYADLVVDMPVAMDNFFTPQIFNAIRKGERVSQMYSGEAHDYFKGAEWWVENQGAESIKDIREEE